MKKVIIEASKTSETFFTFTKCEKLKNICTLKDRNPYFIISNKMFPHIEVDGLCNPFKLKPKGRLILMNDFYLCRHLKDNTFIVIANVDGDSSSALVGWKITYEDKGAKKMASLIARAKYEINLSVIRLGLMISNYLVIGSTDFYDSVIRDLKLIVPKSYKTATPPLYRAIRIPVKAYRELKKGGTINLNKREGTSWTSNLNFAKDVANNLHGMFSSNKSCYCVLLKLDKVPKNQIIINTLKFAEDEKMIALSKYVREIKEAIQANAKGNDEVILEGNGGLTKISINNILDEYSNKIEKK